MFEVELHNEVYHSGGQWHIGEDFPMFTEEEILAKTVLIQADGDELEYLEHVFWVHSAFRTFKCTGDLAKNIMLNMSGKNWATLKKALISSMDRDERKKWGEARSF